MAKMTLSRIKYNKNCWLKCTGTDSKSRLYSKELRFDYFTDWLKVDQHEYHDHSNSASRAVKKLVFS